MMSWLEKLTAWAAAFEAEIERLLKELDERTRVNQSVLMSAFLESYLFDFETSGGKLESTAKNIAKAGGIEAAFNKFSSAVMNDELAKFGEQLLEVSGKSLEYYKEIGIEAKKLAEIEKSLGFVRTIIGLDKDGTLVPDSFLSRLGRSEEVRQKLKNYVVQGIVTKMPHNVFAKGFRELVVGNKETDGALQGYWRQYAYDSYNQVREISALHAADELGLQDFVYQGSVIDTTRPFCRKKAGKVFNRTESAKWRNDPDLIDKKTAATYNPIIERGRFNCRHFLMWITKEQAAEWRKNHSA
jgi:hypothetical protein